MFESHLVAIKATIYLELRDPAAKLCRALALVRRLAQEYMHDNEYPEELAELVKDFAKYLKNTLLPKDDAVLGIDPPEE